MFSRLSRGWGYICCRCDFEVEGRFELARFEQDRVLEREVEVAPDLKVPSTPASSVATPTPTSGLITITFEAPDGVAVLVYVLV